MSYPASYKASMIAADIADKLIARLAGALTLAQSSDTDGYPLINIGTGVAGTQNALIKVLPVDNSQAQDIFGNTAPAYTPHRIQFITELSATAGETLLSGANILKILGEVLLHGCQVEWYMDTNGTAPVIADAVAAKLKGTFYPNVYRPYISQQ